MIVLRVLRKLGCAFDRAVVSADRGSVIARAPSSITPVSRYVHRLASSAGEARLGNGTPAARRMTKRKE